MISPAHHHALTPHSLSWPFAPLLFATLPSSGSAAGGNSVTLTGLGLNGATQVLFGSSPATIVGGDFFGLTLHVVAPPGTGSVAVTVTTSSGTSNPVLYTYEGPTAPPVPTGILPAFGPTTGSTPFVITGSSLADATVTFGGMDATVLLAIDALIVGLTPPGPAGNAEVDVTTAGGTASVPGGFTYVVPPPITVAIVPTSGSTAGGDAFTITGFALDGASVTFGGVAATGVTVDPSGMFVTGATPAGPAGNVDVVVSTAGGTSNVPGGFTYVVPPPVVTTGVTPTSGSAAGGDTFTISGSALSGATVDFGGVTATLASNTDTTITGTTPAGTSGTTVAVTVTTAGGSASAGSFSYV